MSYNSFALLGDDIHSEVKKSSKEKKDKNTYNNNNNNNTNTNS